MSVEEVKKELKDFITRDYKDYSPALEKYLAMCECVEVDGKIYFPSYEYFGFESDPFTLKVESYKSPSYCVLTEAIQRSGIDTSNFANNGDKVLCSCKNDTFNHYYGRWEVIVKCSKCGNHWSAYSG